MTPLFDDAVRRAKNEWRREQQIFELRGARHPEAVQAAVLTVQTSFRELADYLAQHDVPTRRVKARRFVKNPPRLVGHDLEPGNVNYLRYLLTTDGRIWDVPRYRFVEVTADSLLSGLRVGNGGYCLAISEEGRVYARNGYAPREPLEDYLARLAVRTIAVSRNSSAAVGQLQ